jgi:hypothetical protein
MGLDTGEPNSPIGMNQVALLGYPCHSLGTSASRLVCVKYSENEHH